MWEGLTGKLNKEYKIVRKMAKAIVFDLDGTLVHTEPDYRYLVVGETLKELGAQASKRDIDRFWFEGDRDRIIQERFGFEVADFWEVFRKHDLPSKRAKFTKPYEDTTIMLPRLKGRGYKLGIVTGAPKEIAMMEVGLLESGLIDTVVMANPLMGVKLKPDPEGLHKCLRMLGVQNTGTPYVGNGSEDVGAAKAAGMVDVLLKRGDNNTTGLEPSRVITSLHDLWPILDEAYQ